MKKLTNRRGETIAETLIALTLAAVALVLLASMIQSSSNMIATSKEQVKRYVAEENRIAVQSAFKESDTDESEEPGAGGGGAEATEEDGSFGDVTIKPTDGGATATAIKLTDSSDTKIKVRYYVNTQAQGETVEMYNKAVVSYKPDNGEVDLPHDPISGEETGGEGGEGSGT